MRLSLLIGCPGGCENPQRRGVSLPLPQAGGWPARPRMWAVVVWCRWPRAWRAVTAAAPAPAARSRAPARPASAKVGRRRELLGQHRRPARRRPRPCHQHHHQPEHRPALLRADRGRRPHGRRPRSSPSSTASATTAGRTSCWRPTRQRADGAQRRRPGRHPARRQPAPLVLPADVHQVIEAITADYEKIDPADAPTSTS